MAIDSKQIMAEVKANMAKLDGCVGPHDFVRMEEKLFSKFRCTKCGGVVPGDSAGWYRKGLLAGGATPDK